MIDTPFVRSHPPAEVELADIWADVLRLDRVGIHDVFFDLGGHSLPASQVVSRAITSLRVELPLKSLFESPMVAQIAGAITENRAKKADQAEVGRTPAKLEALTEEQVRELACFRIVRRPSYQPAEADRPANVLAELCECARGTECGDGHNPN